MSRRVIPICVILWVDEKRPTPEQVASAYHANDAGAGIAWREGKGENKVVKWEKGLDLARIQECIKKAPIPFVAHFRIPTVGGKNPELCHPFTINDEASIALKGVTKDWVLFHNGHWGDWKKEAIGLSKEMAKQGKRIPKGHWSDTRAMAWFAWACGVGVLEFIDEKCIAFGPDDYEVVNGTGWSKEDGFWASNSHWKNSYHTTGINRGNNYNGSLCIESGCYKTRETAELRCKEHLQEQKDRAQEYKDKYKKCKESPCMNYGISGTDLCHLHTKRLTCKKDGCFVIAGLNSEYCMRHRDELSLIAALENTKKENKESGGAPAETPFSRYMKAKGLFEKGKLSKNKLKRAKREMQQAVWYEAAKEKQNKKNLVKH